MPPSVVASPKADATSDRAGQLFEMEERAIRGVPTRTWKNAPASLRVFSICPWPRRRHLPRLRGRADHLRRALPDRLHLGAPVRDEFGMAQGDRVAIAMRNLPEWVMAFWATTLTGAIVVPLNAWWSGEELRLRPGGLGLEAGLRRHPAGREHPPLPGCLSGFTHSHRDRRAPDRGEPGDTGATAAGGSAPVAEWPFALALGAVDADALPPDVTIDPDDDATIFYTSGTTGRPRVPWAPTATSAPT